MCKSSCCSIFSPTLDIIRSNFVSFMRVKWYLMVVIMRDTQFYWDWSMLVSIDWVMVFFATLYCLIIFLNLDFKNLIIYLRHIYTHECVVCQWKNQITVKLRKRKENFYLSQTEGYNPGNILRSSENCLINQELEMQFYTFLRQRICVSYW